MKKIIVYGIPNCDSVKKAIDCLKNNNIEFDFHNYKKEWINKKTLSEWCKQVGWELLLNKKGTTWKKISPQYEGIQINQKIAIDIMLENNSVIKRPVITGPNFFIVGFDEEKINLIKN
jgi:arsenate reductase